MNTEKAQERLQKLKSHLKSGRSTVSARPDKTSVNSSVVKPRKKERNYIENSSEEKKKRIKELINQTLNKPTSSTKMQTTTRSRIPKQVDVVSVPLSSQNVKNSAQSRLKRVTQQKKAERIASNPTESKLPDQISVTRTKPSPDEKKPSQLPAKYRIPKKLEKPPVEQRYCRPPSPKPDPPAQHDAPPLQYSSSRSQYCPPTTQCRTMASGFPAPTSRPLQHNACSGQSAQYNALPLQYSTSRTPNTQCSTMPAASPAQTTRPSTQPNTTSDSTQRTVAAKVLRNPPSRANSIVQKAAAPSTAPIIRQPPKISDPPPEVQRNLFRRKAPGADRNSSKASQGCSSENPRPQNLPYQRPQAKPNNPENLGWGGWVAKTCKGVVEAVRESISYSVGRPNVTKQLQTVRTLVEPVEMMDYEISCPTFESDQAPVDQTDLHLVIDTNVVLENLDLIRSLKSRKVKGLTPKIIIPWQVLKELDYLKDRHKFDTSAGARKGVRFLLDEIVRGDGFIGGQPQHVASREIEFVVEVPDDHLIKCCLQLKWAGHNVLMLTNDKNLIIKAVVSEVSAMRCDEFSRIIHDNEGGGNKHLTCFESPPPGNYRGQQLSNVNAAHRVIILLRGFLSAVLKKFWAYKFHNLWKLRTPGEEPWALTTLLEIAYETWNEISGGQSQSHSEVILFLRRFIHKVNYGRLVYQDLDQLGRACHELANSLPSSFASERISFDHSLAFLKCIEESGPPADASFLDCCVSLTVHHFQLFEKKAVHYCYGISQNLGIPFNYPKIPPDYQSNPSLDSLHSHLKVVGDIGRSLVRVSASPINEVTKSSEAAQTIYSALTMYLGELSDHRFVLQDVVEFCNCPTMRKSFTSALQDLETISSFLQSISLR
uniref:Transcriptional protein SWT1 n=1 Tax=Lygus hesperus TaxID=30085 RepID=A0A146LHI2_LYGHE